MHPLMTRGYAVFLPNPRGSGGRGRAFAAMVLGDMGGADAADVLAGIDALVARGLADPQRIGVTGGSYGGFMACWLPTLDDRFAASVAISPVADWYSQHFNSNIGRWDADFLRADPTQAGGAYLERSPVMHAARVRTPTLLTAGRNDRCTPPGQAIEFHRALRACGVETELVLYPEEGHGVRRFPTVIDLCTRMVAWFERHMPPGTR
jgi:dipeptidyl aminopeptidase/acylaminoacyl peptidase